MAGVDGAADTQAGDHPYGATAELQLRRLIARGVPERKLPAGHETQRRIYFPGSVKDVVVDLPPGFVGDPQDARQCPEPELDANGTAASVETECPASSMVGMIQLDSEGDIPSGRLLVPGHCDLADLQHGSRARVPGGVRVQLSAGMRSSCTRGGADERRVTCCGSGRFGIPQAVRISNIALTFWGVPAEKVHDCAAVQLERRTGGKRIAAAGVLDEPGGLLGGSADGDRDVRHWDEPGRWTCRRLPGFERPGVARRSRRWPIRR